MPFALLKCFLVLWKQLEVLKEHWGRLKLQGQEINSAPLHKQFSELYEADIFYPSMKALARRVGKEDEFEELIIRSQSILPPMGASEIEIKAQQVHRALQFAFEKLPCCTGKRRLHKHRARVGLIAIGASHLDVSALSLPMTSSLASKLAFQLLLKQQLMRFLVPFRDHQKA
ncbi:coiled-coil domain-containing protein [Cricetulus griseus]|nr:coiled-coil domain-containing protein [Cricetulus griseus]